MIVTSLPMMTSILRAGMAQPGFQPIARVLVVIDAISPAHSWECHSRSRSTRAFFSRMDCWGG